MTTQAAKACWTGEHLIRARRTLQITEPQSPAPGECAVPGCGKRLRNDNTTGVCRRHNHHPQFSSTRNHARNRARNIDAGGA